MTSANPAEANQDEIMSVPRRATSRWSVSRIHSDSVLAHPQRSIGKAASRSSLSSLQTKLHASKSMSDIDSQKLRQQKQANPLFEEAENDIDDTDSPGKLPLTFPCESRKHGNVSRTSAPIMESSLTDFKT